MACRQWTDGTLSSAMRFVKNALRRQIARDVMGDMGEFWSGGRKMPVRAGHFCSSHRRALEVLDVSARLLHTHTLCPPSLACLLR